MDFVFPFLQIQFSRYGFDMDVEWTQGPESFSGLWSQRKTVTAVCMYGFYVCIDTFVIFYT